MSENQTIDDSKPRIKQVLSSQLTGPIEIGANPYGATAYYTYSEILVCDWLSRVGRWNRSELVIAKSSGRTFPLNSIKHVHMVAWPCSITDYLTEDGGWAVDEWRVDVLCNEESNIDSIQVILKVAVRGEGARLNRVAYTWTAYVAEAMEHRHTK